MSFSGPDASKVGTDFNVSLAVLMESETKLAAVCAPQVSSPNCRWGGGALLHWHSQGPIW